MESSELTKPRPGSSELRLATGAAGTVAALAVPVLGVAWFVAEWPGVFGAAVGLGFVLLLFGASALMLARAVKRGQRSAMGVLVGGALGRLVLYAVVLTGLSRVEGLHRPSLALATVVAVTVTLAYELRLLNRMPQLFWVETGQQGASKP